MKDLDNRHKIEYFFQKLSKDTLNLVTEFYDPQVDFVDPVGSIKGAEKIKRYYENQYINVEEIRFDFVDFIESGNQITATWKMTLKTDKLNGGNPFSVDGISHFRFSDKGQAVYHRDYFDMGSFVYERVPVLGYVIRNIKNRFKVDE